MALSSLISFSERTRWKWVRGEIKNTKVSPVADSSGRETEAQLLRSLGQQWGFWLLSKRMFVSLLSARRLDGYQLSQVVPLAPAL